MSAARGSDAILERMTRLHPKIIDLTLGELVSMLGRRADGLADLWNQWGRIRPLLLEDS